MHLLLNTAVTTGENPPTGEILSHSAKGDGPPDSLFSRLLARTLAGSQKVDSGDGENSESRRDSDIEAVSEPGAPHGINGNQNHDTVSSSSSKPVITSESDLGMDVVGSMAGPLETWGDLAGLIQVTNTSGSGNGAISDFTLSGGIPAEFRSQLAADIAANFSSGNGIQTLSLKLESDFLGQVDVKLQAKADQLTVRLLAANRESEAALRNNIQELSESIQKRTGRFQHIEVRVELKASDDLGQESADGTTEEFSDPDPDGRNPEESDTTEMGLEDSDTEKNETEPGIRAQGG